MNATQKKDKAHELIMDKISQTLYSLENEFDLTEAEKEEMIPVIKKQADRVAKLFGYPESWFS